MDAFGSSSASKLNKLISDRNKAFENSLRIHGKSIDENRKNIENLGVKTESSDNHVRELETKIDSSLTDLNDCTIKLKSRLALVERELLKLKSRVNSVEVFVKDSKDNSND